MWLRGQIQCLCSYCEICYLLGCGRTLLCFLDSTLRCWESNSGVNCDVCRLHSTPFQLHQMHHEKQATETGKHQSNVLIKLLNRRWNKVQANPGTHELDYFWWQQTVRQGKHHHILDEWKKYVSSDGTFTRFWSSSLWRFFILNTSI